MEGVRKINADEGPTAAEGEHVAPKVDRGAFHCPYCGVLCRQWWTWLCDQEGNVTQGKRSTCSNEQCKREAYWVDYSRFQGYDSEWVMIKPSLGGGPRPHPLMPEDSRRDYAEAQTIVALSPRGACALLRLGVEKLVTELQPDGRDLNDRIGRMVAAGLPEIIQQALDALRVVGNNAVHPGELDLEDDQDTAIALFECMNLIVEDRIAQPNMMSRIYDRLPAKAREGIERRDAPKVFLERDENG